MFCVKLLAKLNRAFGEIIITDFQDLSNNNLNYPQGDGGSCNTYSKKTRGAQLNFKADSFWYSILGDGDARVCYVVEGYLLRIRGSGFIDAQQQPTVTIGLQMSSSACDKKDFEINFDMKKWYRDPISGDDVGEVDLSSLETTFDPTKVWGISIYLKPYNVDYLIYSISFDSVSPILVTDFLVLDTNSFGLETFVNSQVTKYVRSIDGVGAIFNGNQGARWTSILHDPDTGKCFSGNIKYVRVYGRGLRNYANPFQLALRYSNNADCYGSTSEITKSLDTWFYDPVTGLDYSNVRVDSMAGIKSLYLHSITLIVTVYNQDLNVVAIQFSGFPITFSTDMVMDFTSNIGKNTFGLNAGDGGSMDKYVKVDDGVLLLPKGGSYWYTNLVGSNRVCFRIGGRFLRIYGKHLRSRGVYLSFDIQSSPKFECDGKHLEEWIDLSTWTYDVISGSDVGELDVSKFVRSRKDKVYGLVFVAKNSPPVEFIVSKIGFYDRAFGYRPSTSLFNITDFSRNHTFNLLGFRQGDNGTMTNYSSLPQAALLKPKADSIWFTRLADGNVCFELNSKAILLYGTGFLGSSVTVSLAYSDTDSCSTIKWSDGYILSNWTMDGATGLEVGKVPIFKYKKINPFRVASIMLSNFSNTGNEYYIYHVSLANEADPAVTSTLLTTSTDSTRRTRRTVTTTKTTTTGGTESTTNTRKSTASTIDNVIWISSSSVGTTSSTTDSSLLTAIITGVSVMAILIGVGIVILVRNNNYQKQILMGSNVMRSNPALTNFTSPQTPKTGFENSTKSNNYINNSSRISAMRGGYETVSQGLEATQTISVTTNAIAIPGYLAMDINNDIDGLDNVSNLGAGGTAFIIKAKLKSPGLIVKHGFNDVAIKIIKDDDKTNQTKSDNIRKSFLFEVAMMSHLPVCANIVRMIGYCSDPMAIVMKFYALSLKDLLKRNDYQSSTEVVLKIAYDISEGLRIIHNSGILHLDVKPHNVLIDIDSSLSFNCVICDFGFANFVGKSKDLVSGLNRPNTIGISTRYASPEMFEKTLVQHERFNREEDKKIDVYAYAITLYEIATRMDAWQGQTAEEIQTAVIKGIRPIFNEMYLTLFQSSPGFTTLIEECWDQDPLNRPSFDEVQLRLTRLSKAKTISEDVTRTLYNMSVTNTSDSISKSL